MKTYVTAIQPPLYFSITIIDNCISPMKFQKVSRNARNIFIQKYFNLYLTELSNFQAKEIKEMYCTLQSISSS